MIITHVIILFYLILSFITGLLRVFKGKFFIYDEMMTMFCSFMYAVKKSSNNAPLPEFYEYLYQKNQHLVTDEMKKFVDERIK